MPDTSPRPDPPTPFDPIETITRLDIVRAAPETPCGEVAARLAAASQEVGDVACITDADGRLLGIATLRDCLRADPAAPVAGIQRTATPAEPDWTAEEAAHELVDEALPALPVVAADGTVRGLVPALAAHRYLIEKVEDDTNKAVGIVGEQKDDYLDLSVWADFWRRVPWVLSLAVAGLAAGYVVHVYEDALDALVILALYMPMVADTGGNVGTQSASLVTRAISFGDVTARDAARILWRETRVSLLMAGTLFLFAYLKVLLISNGADVPEGLTLNAIGLAIAIALAAQVVSATLIGAVLPVAAVAARQDPAVVSGPALTTIVDLTGLLLYFGIVTHVLDLSLVAAT
ncbi:magnesium transporter [Acuticoccus kandeliae]|uniref:magnesium transporter n=1 Tax=Acuticoccus kandeliae TaxID=2073160 RepID=UPI000D3E8A6B|nr:magnesium transporter [Acuticoccus kandeliae]